MLDRYDQDLLLDYLEGELDEQRRAQLDTMLAEDPQLAALLSEMASDRAALRSLPHEEAPSDLVNDVTKTLERRMLLDEPVDDLGPIPMSRGRAATIEPTRSINWGRVIGLTGLAAAVALVAGILVITFDDPLQQAANELAANTPSEDETAAAESAETGDAQSPEETQDGLATRIAPDRAPAEPSAEAIAGDDADKIADQIADTPDGVGDDALALRGNERPDRRDGTPGTPDAAELAQPSDDAGIVPTETFAFGRTAAISAIQPRQQLVLLSDSPEASLEKLVEFCIANGIAVVQPEQPALNLAKPEAVDNDNRPIEEADKQAVVAGYALLINDAQLDTLIQNLNTDITLDPKRAGKASLFSNQAALLTDLDEDDGRDNAPSRDLQQDDPSERVADPATPSPGEPSEQANQQTIQLRNPDLGSPYNNERNRYNLLQQASSAQREVALTAPQESLDEASRTVARKSQRAELTPKPAVQSRLDADAALAEDAEQANQDQLEAENDTADASNTKRREAPRRIDPTRGNWLSAHLPVADTTPLLRYDRDEQQKEQAKLVPVMIQRAAPDQVNTLRQRQQDEYANRSRTGEATGEAQTGPAPKADSADTEPGQPDEPRPAEDAPAEPDE